MLLAELVQRRPHTYTSKDDSLTDAARFQLSCHSRFKTRLSGLSFHNEQNLGHDHSVLSSTAGQLLAVRGS